MQLIRNDSCYLKRLVFVSVSQLHCNICVYIQPAYIRCLLTTPLDDLSQTSLITDSSPSVSWLTSLVDTYDTTRRSLLDNKHAPATIKTPTGSSPSLQSYSLTGNVLSASHACQHAEYVYNSSHSASDFVFKSLRTRYHKLVLAVMFYYSFMVNNCPPNKVDVNRHFQAS